MNARYYLPGIGRFLSADTLVPDPSNPQSFNRYSYVLNNPLRYTDPNGHKTCSDMPWECNSEGDWLDDDSQPPTHFLLPTLASILSTVAPLFQGLPIQGAVAFNGFGANWYAERFANPSSTYYNGVYRNSTGLHPGLDFIKAYDPNCIEFGCINVYANVTGVISTLYSGDAKPNVVVQLENGMYVIYGHATINPSLMPGMKVYPGDIIGTLYDQRTTRADGSVFDNTHLHLALRQPTPQGERVYNPVYFFSSQDIVDINWSNYALGETLHTISSYLYGNTYNFWVDPPYRIGLTRY